MASNRFNSVLLLVLLFSFSFSAISSSAISPNETDHVRKSLSLNRESRSFAFYHTTFPVPGLDKAIWRTDVTGKLIMAGLNFNCKGCMCYTFDHRRPISDIRRHHLDLVDPTNIKMTLTSYMTSIDNMQALNYRANQLKSNIPESEIAPFMKLFACDPETENLFTSNNYQGALLIQKYLYDERRIRILNMRYNEYVDSITDYENEKCGKIIEVNDATKQANRESVIRELARRADNARARVEGILRHYGHFK